MNEEKLKNLLHQIDRTAGPPPVPADLAQRVRQEPVAKKDGLLSSPLRPRLCWFWQPQCLY